MTNVARQDNAVRVRPAGAADLVEVVRIEEVTAEAPHWAVEVYAAMIEEEQNGPVERMSKRTIERRLMVAEMDEVVGFVAVKVLWLEQSAVAELESVAVVETMRRKGIGRALCVAAIEWCREQGAEMVELEVRAESGIANGAIALYAALGFIETGQRPTYYQHPTEGALLMTLKLG